MERDLRIKKKLEARSLQLKASAGFSLLEILIAMAIFAMFAGSIFFVYGNIIEIISRTRTRTLSSTLLNREIEIIRLLPYDQVGIIGGFPPGVIAQQRVEVYEGTQFLIKAYVRNIDNAFDGTTGGNPNDTAPADSRIVELEVSCALCYGLPPVTYTTWVAPQNLESSTNNGSLFINAFDANGLPIAEADVKVVNNSTTPTLTIIDQTNASGQLQLVDIPTSTNRYQITVGKTGHSTSMTYLPGAVANPNPVQPHSTVASQQITEISFDIDKVSTLKIKSQDDRCVGIASVSANQIGTKLIGSGPDVVKYSANFTTDSNGLKTIHPLEWDTYKFTNTTSGYDFSGTIPLIPLTLNPNTSTTIALVLEPASPNSLLVTVQNTSGTAMLGASVNIAKTGVDLTKITGERFLTQTDWSGGAYSATDGNIDDGNPAGEIHLKMVGGQYPTSTNSYLISNTYDLGSSSSTLHELSMNFTVPASTTFKFQLAGNNDNATWNFVGPDGTADTYFTVASSSLSGLLINKRYFQYKAYFNTIFDGTTPSLRDVSISYDGGCIPDSQAFFPNLATGNYTVTVSKVGYTTATSSVSVGSGWQETTLILQ
ncbi:MAG: prepilin-type N-terminal cleavage/methylation domain-containing protein [bacterium]|nr:prepilin-type N-terminal cleavage/methylation domain-containing protein [bacterium]